MTRETLRNVCRDLREDIAAAKHQGAMTDAFFLGLILGVVIGAGGMILLWATR